MTFIKGRNGTLPTVSQGNVEHTCVHSSGMASHASMATAHSWAPSPTTESPGVFMIKHRTSICSSSLSVWALESHSEFVWVCQNPVGHFRVDKLLSKTSPSCCYSSGDHFKDHHAYVVQLESFISQYRERVCPQRTPGTEAEGYGTYTGRTHHDIRYRPGKLSNTCFGRTHQLLWARVGVRESLECVTKVDMTARGLGPCK